MNSDEERASFVTDLGEFILDADNVLDGYLDSVGWTRDRLLDQDDVICPFDSGHRMPASSLEKHLETCSWINEGYSREEKEMSVPSSEFFYKDATTVHTVHIDKLLLNKILGASSQQKAGGSEIVPDSAMPLERDVPQTASRAMTNFSSEERWAIYDYVVAEGRAANKLQSIKLEELQLSFERREEPHKNKSHLEMLAEQRDYKRRRQSYRAKNVHITKKSYTEVMKDVIENHMQILMEKSETASAPSRQGSCAREDDSSTSSGFPSRSAPGTRNSWRDKGDDTRSGRYDVTRRSRDDETRRSRDDESRKSREDGIQRTERASFDADNRDRDRRHQSPSHILHRNKRHRSQSGDRSDVPSDERGSKDKPRHHEGSSHHRHHHKKSSHKSHKRRRRSSSRD